MAWIRSMLKIGLIFLLNQAIAHQMKTIDPSNPYHPNRTEVTGKYDKSISDSQSKTSLDLYVENENKKVKKGNYVWRYQVLVSKSDRHYNSII